MNSAAINGKHLLRDWGLHIQNSDVIEPPEVNDTYIDVYGGMTIDVTEANGPVSYKRRIINLELGGLIEKKEWRKTLSHFLNTYHGKEVKIIFDDDKGFYYKGRAYVKGDAKKVARIGKFEMTIDAEPYKYEHETSQDPWKWDEFNFFTGIIRYIGEIKVAGEHKVLIPLGDMLTVPVFYVTQSQNLRVVFEKKEYQLRDGKNRYPQIKIGGPQEMELEFKGSGTVKIDYRGGSL